MATIPTILKQKTAAKRIGVDLYERLDLSAANVDRANSVIKNVKILGKSSLNKHGMDVEGTDYLPSAHNQARTLYENIQVNVGHPPRNDPDAERHPNDRNGVLFNIQGKGGETYGDWKLIPSHPMTARLLDCASDPQLHGQFALSHNAKGYGQISENRYKISSIPKVRSVDVVANGGTNSSLFEGREPMKKPFKTILESALQSTKDRFRPLLELYEDMGDMPVDPVAAPPSDAPPAEAPATDYMAHLGELVKSITMDTTLTPEEKTDKIMAAIKVMEETKEKPKDDGVAAETKEDDSTAADTPESKEASAKTKLESLEKEELTRLRGQEQVRNLCESLDFHPSAVQMKALVTLNDADRKAFIKEQKPLKPASGRTPLTTPRTTPSRTTNVQESRGKVKDVDFTDTSEEARRKRAADWKS